MYIRLFHPASRDQESEHGLSLSISWSPFQTSIFLCLKSSSHLKLCKTEVQYSNIVVFLTYHSEVGIPVRWKWIVIKVHILFALPLTIASQKVFVLDVYSPKHNIVMVTAGETPL